MADFSMMTDAEFRREIAARPALGYLLFGKEDYLKTRALADARRTLGGEQAFAPFNEIVLDALDYTPDRLRAALLALPMMAERKVVVLRGMDMTDLSGAEMNAFCEVLAELPEYDYNTLLVPVSDGLIEEGYLPKKPAKTLAKLAEYLRPVRYDAIPPAKLAGWCGRHFAHYGVRASDALCRALPERCGRQMYTLAAEIEKVCYYVLSRGGTAATEDDVAAVTIPVLEYDTYAFSNALIERDAPRALALLADLKFRRVEPILLLGEVVGVACDMLSVLQLTRTGLPAAEVAAALSTPRRKMPEFKVGLYARAASGAGERWIRSMIAACEKADRALKRSPAGYEALEVLICSL